MSECRAADADRRSRDFDYGVGDEQDAVLRRARRQIAAEIRRAASVDEDLTPAAERAYELAARVAEQSAHESADTRASGRSSHHL